MDIKEKLVKKLEEDCDIILNEKMARALDHGDEGTYRNLARALRENLELIDNYRLNTLKNIVVRSLSNVRILDSEENEVAKIGYIPDIEIHPIDGSRVELIGKLFPNDNLMVMADKEYKVVAEGSLKGVDNLSAYFFELLISNTKIVTPKANPIIIFKISKLNDLPLYTIVVH